MKVLVVGSGGREHALAWKIARSKRVNKVFSAPGNAGTAAISENVAIKADDLKGLLDFAKKEKIGLTVAGPEIPLVLGIKDLFESEGLKVFGPRKKAALLEGSKIYAKSIMRKYGVPTADFQVFDNPKDALQFVSKKNPPVVIKADGLAAGKGVFICHTIKEAENAISEAMVKKAFGESGKRIIVEDALSGEEASILVITDGENICPLASSQDHKRIFDGDKGANTGGMGAYSPAPVVTEILFEKIMNEVIYPVIRGMKSENNTYKGVLYAGVMITDDGPKVLEFNVRFGDPETQAILPRMKSDLVEFMELAISGGLKEKAIEWDERPCVSVVLASGGYPGAYDKGRVIKGLDRFKAEKDLFVFHAATKKDNGNIVTDGGRVLNISGMGNTIKHAVDRAYDGVSMIRFEGMQYRKDIGHKALKRPINI